MEAILPLGSRDPLILSKSIRRQRDGLDAGTIEVLSVGEFDYTPGAVAPVYSGLEIEDVDTDTDGEDFIHKLACFGVLGVKPERRERGYPRIRKTIEGWDEGADSWITTASRLTNFNPGATLVGYATMFIVESEPEPLYGNYYRVGLAARGLAWSKPVKRVIRCNEQIVQPGQPITVNLAGGWLTPKKTAASLPRIVVIDSYVTNAEAPTDSIPGFATPNDPPDVQIIGVTGSDLTYNWPYGWKLADVSSDPLGNTGYKLLTLTYEYVHVAIF